MGLGHFGFAPELGFGIAHWSACRRVYVALEVHIGAFPNGSALAGRGVHGGRNRESTTRPPAQRAGTGVARDTLRAPRSTHPRP